MSQSINELKGYWVGQQGIAPEDFLVLAMHVLRLNRTQFLREKDHLLNDTQLTDLVELLQRRFKKEPVAYLTGQKEFFGRNFRVTPDTLIPRPDSECVIEDVLDFYAKDTQKPSFLFDIGTGSGALAITLQKELHDNNLLVIASDISPTALEVAKSNANIHQASVTFLKGSLLQPFYSLLTPNSSLYIIANLPYVSEVLLKQTEPDVQNYEPITALLSADQGQAHYKALLKEIQDLPPSITLTCWLEISPEQTKPLTQEITRTFPNSTVVVGLDLSQKNRFLRFSL